MSACEWQGCANEAVIRIASLDYASRAFLICAAHRQECWRSLVAPYVTGIFDGPRYVVSKGVGTDQYVFDQRTWTHLEMHKTIKAAQAACDRLNRTADNTH